jgi:hypothetical protein
VLFRRYDLLMSWHRAKFARNLLELVVALALGLLYLRLASGAARWVGLSK